MKNTQTHTNTLNDNVIMVHTGQQAMPKVAGVVCVAQDSRLTCLSVFDLSIRAQTLAM